MRHRRILKYVNFYLKEKEKSLKRIRKTFRFMVRFFSYAEHPFQDNKNAKIQMIILKWFMC